MRNIAELPGQIKLWVGKVAEEWGIAIIVFLIALGSFGLGRLSAIESVRPPVSITSAAAASAPFSMSAGGLIVASRAGEKYFFPWCSGAQAIVEKNKIWFQSEEAARSAGYAPAKNCKGLK
ncbi:MAG: Endonuclease I [Parcubacteria group bacterium GW2011_GWA2_51_10]|nr:MAG: Endonuclease I [Parcubacteria group bacterium GW2011_GWA2_51_10]